MSSESHNPVPGRAEREQKPEVEIRTLLAGWREMQPNADPKTLQLYLNGTPYQGSDGENTVFTFENRDGTLFCTVNGETYLYPELRRLLLEFRKTQTISLQPVVHEQTVTSTKSEDESIESPNQGFERLINALQNVDAHTAGWFRLNRLSLLISSPTKNELGPGLSISLDMKRVRKERRADYEAVLAELVADLQAPESRISSILSEQGVERLVVQVDEAAPQKGRRIVTDIMLGGDHTAIPDAEVATESLSIPIWKRDISERSGPGDNFFKEVLALRSELYGFAVSLSRSRERAEDLVQTTFEKAHQSRASYEKGTNLKAWLYTILRNRFLTEERKEASRKKHHLAVAWAAEQGARLTDQESTMRLRQTLAHMQLLPDEQREAIMLVGAQGLSYEEAAEKLGVAVGTIKSRVSRGRETLRDLANQDNEE